MHQSAMFYGEKFFENYCSGELSGEHTIVEIGSQDVNGSLRELAPVKSRYIGLDFIAGRGVDIIMDDPYKIPLPDNSADAIVTSSCFEHSEFFWLVFLEISRIVKPGGYIYINAPSNGMFHRYPVDCWRFFPDSGEALASWARKNAFNIELLESFIGVRSEEDIWNDFVSVYQKNDSQKILPRSLILDNIENYTNARTYKDNGVIANFEAFGSDFSRVKSLGELLSGCESKIHNLEKKLHESDVKINAILSSNSWRVTFLFRWAARFFKRK